MGKEVVEDNNIDRKIEEFKKENKEISSNKIENVEDLRASYEQAKTLYKEILKNLPLVAKEMTKRGMNLVINEVNQSIDNKKNQIAEKVSETKKGVKTTTKNIKDKVIEKKDEVKGKVEETKTAVKNKAKAAKTGIKNKAKETKTGIENKAKETKTGIKNKAQKVKSGIEDKVTDTKKSVHSRIEDIKEGLNEEEQKKTDMFAELEDLSNERKEEIAEWQKKYAGRNKFINKAVEKISLNSLKMKTIEHGLNIKLTTVATKGARLVGEKGLAKKLSKETLKDLKEEMGQDTRSGRFARKLAENIYSKSDKAKEVINDKKEKLKEGTEKVGKAAIKGVKKGAFAIGKGGYKGAAFLAGLGEIAIEGVNSRVNDAGEKISEKAGEIKESAIDKKNIGSNYIDMASKKIQLIQTKAKMGVKGFFKNIAEGVIKKLEPSLVSDKEKTNALEQGIETNKSNIRNIKDKSTEADGLEMG